MLDASCQHRRSLNGCHGMIFFFSDFWVLVILVQGKSDIKINVVYIMVAMIATKLKATHGDGHAPSVGLSLIVLSGENVNILLY